jgi:DNA polymerase type B, organellar and viral
MRRKARRWVGVDGEGVGRKPHRYVLLACSDGDYVESRHGLSTVDCLEFLLDLGTRDARVCGYYLSYDWTMMLQDLDDAAIFALWRPELRACASGAFSRVSYKDYRLHWLAGAMWISDARDKRHVTIWDLGKYYQGPFVNAIKDWNVRPDVQEEIARMKKRRSLFTFREIKNIRKYCMHECEALAEFADKLERAHTDADLKPRGWFGPGSTASVLLNRHSIAERRGIIPPPMIEPVACAFFGGRAEISRTGYVRGPIHGYDISSAYPHHISRLPCLEHGRWQRVAKERALTARGVVGALVHGHVRHAPGDWGPLPVRVDNGSIVFPRAGASGWWWRDEWLAARQGWKGLEFDHAYVLRKECDCQPFHFVPPLFEHRKRVGKETGEGKILKLALNSLYGKLAQTIGRAQFASRVWAGMITSNTRAQVLRLMLQHESLFNVLMIATDGLFSTEDIDVGKEIVLGGWEHAVHDSITLVRPGIYWLGGAEILPFEQPVPVMERRAAVGGSVEMVRVRQGETTALIPVSQLGGTKVRARGLGRDNLDSAKVQLALALHRGADKVLLAPRTTFGAGKAMVYGPDAEHCRRNANYGQWHLMPTHVSLAPAPKRAADWSPPVLDDVESQPYGTRSTRQTGEFFEFLELLRDLMN